MRTYSFDFLAADGAIYACDVANCDGDADAAGKARLLLHNHVDAVGVDVWLDGIRVARIERAYPPTARSGDCRGGASA